MRSMTFPVLIGFEQQLDVDVYVNDETAQLIAVKAAEGSMSMEGCTELSELHGRIIDRALDLLANLVYDDEFFIDQNLGGAYDYDAARDFIRDNYELTVDWPYDDEEN